MQVTDDEKYIKVGELLVYAEVVSSSDITEAIQVSRRLNVPIGRVLLTSGCVTEPVLHATLELQPMVKIGEVPLDGAIKALNRVFKTGNTLKQELEALNYYPTYGKGANDLADLLIDSNIVSQETIDQALKSSFNSGTPLGTTLVLQGALSPGFFPHILGIHDRIRQGDITHDLGIEELKAAFHVWIKAEASLKQELLKATDDAVSEPQKQEKGKGKKKEEARKQSDGALARSAKEVAEPALKNEAPQPEPARQEPQPQVYQAPPQPAVLDADKRSTISRLQPKPGSGRLIDLVQLAGLVDNVDLQQAFTVMLDDSQRTGEFLVEAGLIDESTRRNALRCQTLIKRGKLKHDEAVAALKQARKDNIPVVSILRREGIVESGPVEQEWKHGIAAGIVGGFLAAVVSLIVAVSRLVRNK